MKKLLATLLILVACIHVNAQESRQIRISTDRTDLILEVAPDGRLYQSYLGDKLLNEQDLKTFPAPHEDGKFIRGRVEKIISNRP